MENILRICGAALCAAALGAILRQTRPEFAVYVSAAGGILLLGAVMTAFSPTVSSLKSLLDKAGLGDCFGVLLKALGITIAASSAADLCRDLGESALGAKVELAARAELLLLALPLLERLLRAASELLS